MGVKGLNMASKKRLTLHAYEIKERCGITATITHNVADLVKRTLSEKRKVKDRYKKSTNLDESIDGDVISDFKTYGNYLCGLFVRLKKGFAINISTTTLDRESFGLSEMLDLSNEDITGHIDRYLYFFMNDKYIICSASSIKEKFEKYFNWLLIPEEKNPSRYFELTPIPNDSDMIDIDRIKEIHMAYDELPSEYRTLTKHFNLEEISKSLFPGITSEICAAYLTIKIKKKSDIEKDQYLKLMDTSGIEYKTRDGATIKGATFLKRKVVSVDVLSSYLPDENFLYSQMCDFMEKEVIV